MKYPSVSGSAGASNPYSRNGYVEVELAVLSLGMNGAQERAVWMSPRMRVEQNSILRDDEITAWRCCRRQFSLWRLSLHEPHRYIHIRSPLRHSPSQSRR